MAEQVRVVQVEAVPTAVVRRHAALNDLARVIPEACGTVAEAVKAAGGARLGCHVAIYLGHMDGRLDLEVGVELERPFEGRGQVIASATPAGEAAVLTHHGPYSALTDAHATVRRWCDARDRLLDGVCWERYGHWRPAWKTDPSLIRTDVFYLLRSRV